MQHCRGSAECFSGCPNSAKKSLDITYVPAAIRAGARVYTSVRAERIVAKAKGLLRMGSPESADPGPAGTGSERSVPSPGRCQSLP